MVRVAVTIDQRELNFLKSMYKDEMEETKGSKVTPEEYIKIGITHLRSYIEDSKYKIKYSKLKKCFIIKKY
jgi:hypothetical protein